MLRVLSLLGLRGNSSNDRNRIVLSMLVIGITVGLGYKLIANNTSTTNTTTKTTTTTNSDKKGKRKVLILFGTCSGTAKKMAHRLGKLIASNISTSSITVKVNTTDIIAISH